MSPTNLKVRHRETQKSRQREFKSRKERSDMKRPNCARQYSIEESYVNPDLSRTAEAILEVVNARKPCASCSPGFVTGAGATFLCAAGGEDFADCERLVLYLPGPSLIVSQLKVDFEINCAIVMERCQCVAGRWLFWTR